jgi:phospholipase C
MGKHLRRTRRGRWTDHAGCDHGDVDLPADHWERPVPWQEIAELGGRPLTAAQLAAYEADRQRWAIQGEPPAGLSPEWQTRLEDNEAINTHLWLCNRALALLERSDDSAHRGMAIWLANYRRAWQRAVYEADYIDPYCNISWWGGYRGCKFFSHFYDPDTGLNWRGQRSPTALTEGARWWRTSLEEARDGNLFDALYHLGISLHYLTDLTQPMHASNFTFLSSMPPGYHTSFEAFAAEVQPAIPLPESGWFDLAPPVAEAWLTATARLAKRRMGRIWHPDVRAAWHRLDPDCWHGLVRPVLMESLAEGCRIAAGYMAAWWQALS